MSRVQRVKVKMSRSRVLLPSRRDFGLAALGLGAGATLLPRWAAAQAPVAKPDDISNKELKDLPEDAREEAARLLGMEVCIFGYPLVLMDVTRAVMTAAAKSGEYSAPVGQFTRMLKFADPDFKNILRLSRDGLWSTAFIDLGGEPFILTIPAITGRHYIAQGLNMWSDNFMSLGPRTTGMAAGNFLISGPRWEEKLPAGVKTGYPCATRFAWLRIQTIAAGPQDFQAVIAIENDFKLTPLSAWGKPDATPDSTPVEAGVDTTSTPSDQVERMDAGTFYGRLARLMKDNPPYPSDQRNIGGKIGKLGIAPGADFDIGKIDPAIARGLNRAVKDAQTKIADAPIEMKGTNGWSSLANLSTQPPDYDNRAALAGFGLGAPWGEDVLCPTAYHDGDGKLLDGAGKYVLRLEKDDKGRIFPSNAGIWSVSAYDGNYQVRNPIDRYAISPSMPLKYNADGSLDIYLQSAPPGPDKESNWLACAPSGRINVTIRVYWPEHGLLDGSFKMPPIRRVA